jgi:hypothetical protein
MLEGKPFLKIKKGEQWLSLCFEQVWGDKTAHIINSGMLPAFDSPPPSGILLPLSCAQYIVLPFLCVLKKICNTGKFSFLREERDFRRKE